MNPSLVGHPNKRGSPLTAELLLHICSQWTQFPLPIISYITFPCLCIFAFFQLWIQQIWRKRFHLFFFSQDPQHILKCDAPPHFFIYSDWWRGIVLIFHYYDRRLPPFECVGRSPVMHWCVRRVFAYAHGVCCCCWVHMKQSHFPPLLLFLQLMTTHPYKLDNRAGLWSYWKLSLKWITRQRMGLREGRKL